MPKRIFSFSCSMQVIQFADLQFGHSCKSQLRITMHNIMKSFDIKKQVDLVSEDERKQKNDLK
jgi:hypothetical protein